MQKNPTGESGLIRLAHPLAFIRYLGSQGESAHDKLRAAGLPVYADEPSLWVPLKSAWRFFDIAAKAGGRSLGWQVGHAAGDANLADALRVTIEHAPTLLQGLRRMIRLIRTESSQLKLSIVERRDRILLCTQYPFKNWPGYHNSQGYQLSTYINVIRHYCGANWMPAEIGIEDCAVSKRLQSFYPNVRILDTQPMGYIAIMRDDLIRPPLAKHICNELVSIESGIDDSKFSKLVHAMAISYLADGHLSAGKIADLLDVSQRTLFRRLAAENMSYQDIVNEARFSQAKYLLQNSQLSIKDIAIELGINDPSNFSRMFRHIGGMTPGAYRRLRTHQKSAVKH